MREKISRWLQYLYFLRFPILAWLFLPVLLLLDSLGKTTSITRGIFTMENGWQAYNAAFFIVALNMTVLITARNIIRNGADRFVTDPPTALNSALCTTTKAKHMWLTLFVVHVPTLYTIWRLYALARYEGMTERFPFIWINLLGGLLAGMIFWFLVSLFYYWTYRPSEKRSPSALIFPDTPKNLFVRVSHLQSPSLVGRIEDLVNPFLKLTYSGYAGSENGPLWELHFLSGISLLGFFLLYLFLYSSTAPVPRHLSFYILSVLALLLFALHVWIILSAPSNGNPLARKIQTIFFLTALGLLIVFFWTNLGPRGPANRLEFAFPALASILVISTFALWFLAGFSFLLDRYRVSVIVVSILFIFGIKELVPRSGEHYYAVKPLQNPVAAPSPKQAVAYRITRPGEPYIIVTASGGGIHAAAWTARVLYLLEEKFANDKDLAARNYTFHDHLVLASGVSGGSVGLMPYLLEYTFPNGAFTGQDFQKRITAPPACSSLEAVAWGLQYYDLYRLVLTTGFPWSLFGDERPDRSWALAEAFNRNLHDPNCQTPTATDLPDGNKFALNDAADRLSEGKMPAFTFNTTSEETGNRFLLSNYSVPPSPTTTSGPEGDFVPSESFLEVYAQKRDTTVSPKDCPQPLLADLPLATAARLSATFPYVSSGTRVPPCYATHAYHFLDGGYFDNDGTASVIEFLKSALDSSPEQSNMPAAGPPRRILLIEIRDGSDLSQESEDDAAHQSTASDWKTGAQLTAPPKGLWNAGHVSISRRNRRELCLLERAYPEIDIHHVIFPIDRSTTLNGEPQPLSWKLTVKQLDAINQQYPNAEIENSVNWVRTLLAQPDVPATNDVCRANP